MSRFLTSAALAVFFVFSGNAHGDTIAAALTPPRINAELPTPDLPETQARFEALGTPQAKRPAMSKQPIAEIVARQANISNFGTVCTPDMSVSVVPGAILDLTVSAPCLPSSDVSIEHGGLSFTVALSMTGDARLRVPAMDADAQIIATLSDGMSLFAQVYVPRVAKYARVALQWRGVDPGELIASAPSVLEGDLFRLGTSDTDGSGTLHVFSKLLDDVTASGVIRLSLRSDVTAQNCADGQSAKVRRMIPGEPVTAYDIAIKGPGCGAIGQSLELKNVLQDLKLGAN